MSTVAKGKWFGLSSVALVAVVLTSCKVWQHNNEDLTNNNSGLSAVHDDKYSLALKHTHQGYEFVACLGSLETLNTASCVRALSLPDGRSLDYSFVSNKDISLQDLEEIDRVKRALAKEYMDTHGDLPPDYSFMSGGAIVGGGAVAAGVSKVRKLLMSGKVLDAKLLFSSLSQQKKLSPTDFASLLSEFNQPATLDKLKTQAGQRWAYLKRNVLSSMLENTGKYKGRSPAKMAKQMNHFYNNYTFRQGVQLGGHLQDEMSMMHQKLDLLGQKPAPQMASGGSASSAKQRLGQSALEGDLWVDQPVTKNQQQNLQNRTQEVLQEQAEHQAQQQAFSSSKTVGKDSVRYQAAAKQAKQAKMHYRNGEFHQAQVLHQSIQDHWLLDDIDKIDLNRDVLPYSANQSVLLKRFNSLYQRGRAMLSEGKDMTQFLTGSLEDVHMDLMNQSDVPGSVGFSQRETLITNLKKEAASKGLFQSKQQAPFVAKAVSKQAPMQRVRRGITLSKNNKIISASPPKIGGRVMRSVGWGVTLVGGLAVIIAVVNHAGSKTLTDLKSLYPWGGGGETPVPVDNSAGAIGSGGIGSAGGTSGTDTAVHSPADLSFGTPNNDTSQEILGDMAAGVPFVPISVYGTYYPFLIDNSESLEVPSVISVLKTLAIHASYGNAELASQVQICLPMSMTVPTSNCQAMESF
ncbi:MAG: hypothetical protein OXC44_01445 [Proteobacteria bacterium]|nr:hypothetical protein [Pseudomonadota bacterium]